MAPLCAVRHRPEMLLLDEPAGGLDPVARREFLETSMQLLNRVFAEADCAKKPRVQKEEYFA